MDRESRPKIQDGLAQLKKAHVELEDLFEQYFACNHSLKKQLLVKALSEKLTLYITLLTFFYYPAVMDVLGNTQEYSRKTIMKYAQFKQLITELEDLAASSGDVHDKMAALKSCFQYHVKEEETLHFPKIRRSDLNLKVLGSTLLNARQRLQRDLKAKGDSLLSPVLSN